ncbi:hypothetical protein RKD23_001107 [Streptomyces sp. SAI-170]|uniref:hypothetical protein n=1 Tax=Streptomyces sp. SAI-170 TaxID=3377729 RepID=UPI003C7E7A6F
MADAQITLAYSRNVGIVAIATGEQYEVAQTALVKAGFHRGEAGVYRLPSEPADTAHIAMAGLIRSAEAHRMVVTTSSRRFIGDAARDIAGLLPGRWDTKVEIYSHPVWQQDLVPWLWDSGELAQVVHNEQIPYAATLTDAALGTTLLLVEHPGSQLGYLLGAFAPELFGEGHGDPHAPSSIVLPPFPGRAARAITERYLPAYDHAVHVRRTAAVTEALDLIRAQYDTWTALRISRHDSATTPLAVDALGAATADFLDCAWREFPTVLDHAPAVLDRCRPATTPSPQDARVLDDLTTALLEASDTRSSDVHLSRTEHHQQTWRAIEFWLAHADVFLRQARAASPRARSACPSRRHPSPCHRHVPLPAADLRRPSPC